MVSASVRTGLCSQTQRIPSRISATMPSARSTGCLGAGRQHHPRHQDHAERDQHRLGHERQHGAQGEQRGADRRPDQLVGGQSPGEDPGVRDPEVALVDQHRQQRRRRGVGERLGGAEQEHRDQDHRHVGPAGHDREAEQPDHDHPDAVGGHHQPTPVEAVGLHPGVQAEQQPRQPLQERRERDQGRVVGARGDQQRAGGERDAVADVAGPRRRQQPAEGGAEACGDDGLDESSRCG